MATPALAARAERTASRPSRLAGSLVGSEILKIAADVRALAADGLGDVPSSALVVFTDPKVQLKLESCV